MCPSPVCPHLLVVSRLQYQMHHAHHLSPVGHVVARHCLWAGPHLEHQMETEWPLYAVPEPCSPPQYVWQQIYSCCPSENVGWLLDEEWALRRRLVGDWTLSTQFLSASSPLLFSTGVCCPQSGQQIYSCCPIESVCWILDDEWALRRRLDWDWTLSTKLLSASCGICLL